MSSDTKEELINKIRNELQQSVSNTDWKSLSWQNAAVDGVSSGKGTVELADGSMQPVSCNVTADFSRLRKVMASPETGGWYSAIVHMTRQGGFTIDFNYDEHPKPVWDYVAPMYSDPPPSLGKEILTDLLIEDHKAVPRPKYKLPSWHPSANTEQDSAVNRSLDVQSADYVTPKSDSPADLFIAQSINGMRDATAFHCKTWHLDEIEMWNVDMETGIITFTLADSIVTAPVQVIGTLHNNEFMWGWDHPSVPESLRHDAALAKDWGNENSLSEYTERLVAANEDKAWEFTAVAMKLANANGTYRGQINPGSWAYLCFGLMKMSPRRSKSP